MIEQPEVWCRNDANPTHEVVAGVPLCSLCLWKLRSKTWNTQPSAKKGARRD